MQLQSVSARYRGLLSPRAIRPIRRAGQIFAAEAESTAPAVDSSLRDARIQRLEAVLLLAREPLSSRKLSQFAGLDDGTQARTLVGRLNRLYDEHGRAFRVEEVAGGFQLLTRPKFAPWLRRLGHVPAETRLSAPAMETLAVIAYRQPVLRADVEAIRGVNCGEILRQLLERDLVRVGGRSEELGRPYLYSTTRRFLQLFGLREPADLPRAEMVRGTLAQAATTAEDQGHQVEETTENLQTRQTEEESDVKVTIPVAQRTDEQVKRARRTLDEIEVLAIDDDDVDVDEDEDDDLDDEDDLDDDEDDEDWDDDEEDFDEEELEDEEADEEEEEDLEDDEWEEVEDEEELDEEDDDDWDDDEDEDDEGWDDEDDD
jgi:segregation and condensation protein B